MKQPLTDLNDALTFLLKGLYDAELKLQKAIPPCSRGIASAPLRTEVEKYYASSNDKLLKLHRVFSYLMTEPEGRKNEVMKKMIDDTKYVLKQASNDHIRDVVLATCIENINHYKIAGYRSALSFAIATGLDNVADLLSEILEWEREASRSFARIDLSERIDRSTAMKST